MTPSRIPEVTSGTGTHFHGYRKSLPPTPELISGSTGSHFRPSLRYHSEITHQFSPALASLDAGDTNRSDRQR